MRYSIRNVPAEFTPQQVAAITDVSPTLQRDWRRRGILPEKRSMGWSQFNLDDVIKILALRLVIEGGHIGKDALDFMESIVLRTLMIIEANPAAHVVDHDDVPEDLVSESKSMPSIHGSYHRFALVYRSNGQTAVSFTNDLSRIKDMAPELGLLSLLILDLEMMGHRIVERAGGPVIRHEIEMIEE